MTTKQSFDRIEDEIVTCMHKRLRGRTALRSWQRSLPVSAIDCVDGICEVEHFVNQRIANRCQTGNDSDADQRDEQNVLHENSAAQAAAGLLYLLFQSLQHDEFSTIKKQPAY